MSTTTTRTAPVMALYQVRVHHATFLSPNLRRVTLADDQLSSFPYAGADQRVKLLLPQSGQDHPHLDGVSSIPEFLALPDDVRPVMRTYTVRRHRPAAGEIDIDFALHGDLGPASRWAVQARPGDPVAIYGPAASYHPPADTRWQLIVGDDTAQPAIGAILESLPPGTPARVYVELADPADMQPLFTPARTDVEWRFRGAVPARNSTLLLDAVRTTDLPQQPGYAWLAGESSIVTTIRRHLINERGLDRDRVTFTGYWRHGLTESD